MSNKSLDKAAKSFAKANKRSNKIGYALAKESGNVIKGGVKSAKALKMSKDSFER